MKPLWYYCLGLTLLWWMSFQYVLHTRPRIDFVPDHPKTERVTFADGTQRELPTNQYLTDCNGFDYPHIVIYHKTFWNNFPTNGRLPFFEPDAAQSHYWVGRFTNMDGFLTNHGRFTEWGKNTWLDQTSTDYCQKGLRSDETPLAPEATPTVARP